MFVYNEGCEMAKKSRGNLYQDIYIRVRDDILNQKYAGGTFLSEAELCERYGVSRTPVREALIRLAQDQYIEMIPNHGALVPHLTIHDIMELCEIRAANEGMAAYLCAKRRNDEMVSLMEQSVMREEALLAEMPFNSKETSQEDFTFHRLLHSYCGNTRLNNILTLIHNQMERIVRSSADERAIDTLSVSIRYHRDTAEAIKKGDADAARDRIVAHWYAMLEGYVHRDLSGYLSKNI